MSEIMRARREMLKKLNVMVRKIEEITAFVLTGESACPPYEIRLVTAAAKSEDLEKIYADLNFLVSEFLAPQTRDREESEERTVARYRFENGLFLEVFICGEDHLPSFDWWVPYFDKHGAAERFYPADTKRAEDPTGDMLQESAPAPAGPAAETAAAPTVSEPIPAEPVTAAAPVPVPEMEKTGHDELSWEHIYGKVNLAKHAIAGGSVIYAGEIINELRTLLIRLICEKSGITENYAHSIDLLSNEYQKALIKTYPAKPEGGAMIAALAAELSLFEKLMD